MSKRARLAQRSLHRFIYGFGCIVVLGLSSYAQATTLSQALVSAYHNNATLQSQRAVLQEAESRVSEARGGRWPKVSINANAGFTHDHLDVNGFPLPQTDLNFYPYAYGLTVQQPIYQGGRIGARIDQAKSRLSSQQAHLLDTEQNTLLQATTAYMDVLRDEAVVKLERSNVHLLKRALREVRASFNNGERTQTDVQQAEARLSGARASRIQAKGSLISSRARYLQVVGAQASHLHQPPQVIHIPESEARAVTMAAQNYPVVAAEKSLTAARHNVDVVSGQLLPSLSIDGEVINQHYPNALLSTENRRAVMLDFSMPLYSGGVIRSQIDEAKHRVRQNQAQLVDAHRSARQSATQAWQQYQTAKTQLKAIRAQIKAAHSAYNSILSEYRVGERTTLDVLDAEQQYLSARVNMVRAKRTQIVAAFSLKAAVGQLTARDLGLQVSQVGAP